jgi:ribosome-associated heat shock protein Hsp15
MAETVRIDKWLWSVRIFKTRSAAATGCRGGHVKIEGRAVKPSRPVAIGDTVSAQVGARLHELEVVRLIDKRVGASLAAECFIDHSPPPPPRATVSDQGARERGSGRPTKKERRQLERFRSGRR